ncbi:hypothetical protein [Sporomusa acidovorans]|uniref:Uncharacterized protein n=1 Tax=Sporomusa acidovorans (strain ATCC 49682 / DSM 3132 / Mol) TaxID=1123286 RepID=A0ABZ3IXU3_SPOA4|nr:hypothetical protein [Sporomusa acidovorans]OZC15821.1 hypothetical protein SPACI_46410 [Sporomusa acidovorans DSM 3132]SDF30230.1 hypothetical protein SAMN04488499_104240 [Sporomusa acidovorans]
MSPKKILFSPVTRLSGLLSVELTFDNEVIQEADVSYAKLSPIFRAKL